MFKKWISVKAPARNNNQNNENENNNCPGDSSSGMSEDNNRRSVFAMRKTKRPTIIRPNDPLPPAKIKRPPRPPPPKFNSSGCVSAFSLDPPSYEEVLIADAKAKKNRLEDTTNKKRPAPRAPSSDTQMTSLIDIGTPSLIDLDTSLNSWDDFNSTSNQIGDLHELEDIFNNFSLTNEQFSSSIPPLSTNPMSINLLEDDIYLCTDQLTNINSAQNFNNAIKKNDGITSSNQKPVPLPRHFINSSRSTPNNDLTLNLLNNTTTSSTVDLGNLRNNGSLFTADASEETPPVLPPRPLEITNDIFSNDNSETSVELSLQQTPHLPPKPQNYKEVTQDVNSRDTSIQRLEPHGIALYDYTATQNDELTFKINETVTLIHRINDEWLYGCVGDKEGMFPRSFVHVIIPLPDDPEFHNSNPSVRSGPRCLALYDYVADSDDDLQFRVGTMIPLISKVSDFWFKGVLDGKIGLIPSNFVRVIEDLPEVNGVNETYEAEVLQDYSRGFNYELDCKKGDLIKIIYPIDNEWVMAQLANKAGILPWSILEVKH